MQVGKADVTAVIGRARERLGGHGRRTILFLDEIHRFNKAQQDALLPVVESGLITLIGATTENPYFEINSALLSRCALFEFLPHTRRRPDAARGARRGRPAREPRRGHGRGDRRGVGRRRRARRSRCSSWRGRRRSRAASPVGPEEVAEAAMKRPGALRPRRRRALRRRVGLHQEHARLRPRRGHLLAGGDDRRRRGSEVHRAARDRVRLGGRRQRRPARARDRRGRGARRSSSSACRRRASTSRRPSPTWRWRRSRTPPSRPSTPRSARCGGRAT